MHTSFNTTVTLQLAADRRDRLSRAGERSRRHRQPVAPDLIRVADLGPVAAPAGARRGAGNGPGGDSTPDRDRSPTGSAADLPAADLPTADLPTADLPTGA